MTLADIVEGGRAAGALSQASSFQAQCLLACLAPPGSAGGIVVSSGVNAVRQGDGWRLTGGSPSALFHGRTSTLLVLAAGTLFRLALPAPGVSLRAAEALDGLPVVDVSLQSAPVDGDAANPLAASRLAPARLALAAEMAGASRAALDLALSRARTRRVFGRPIGAFQALSHRLVDAFVDVESMDMAVREAAAEGGVMQIVAAKALCAEAGRRVVATAQQVWGGEGYHADQPVQAFTRRVLGLSLRLGPPDAEYGRLTVEDGQ
jgi:alkylation response protein AidB-like acyl-CoA dehydrogenase